MTENRAITYYLQAESGGPIKIGFSVQLSNRLRDLTIGSPVKLRIVGVEFGDVEAVRHNEFARYRLHGEWFTNCHDLCAFIKSLAPLDIPGVEVAQPLELDIDFYNTQPPLQKSLYDELAELKVEVAHLRSSISKQAFQLQETDIMLMRRELREIRELLRGSTVDVNEAARLLGCHPETVRKRCRAGELPFVPHVRPYRFVRAELLKGDAA